MSTWQMASRANDNSPSDVCQRDCNQCSTGNESSNDYLGRLPHFPRFPGRKKAPKICYINLEGPQGNVFEIFGALESIINNKALSEQIIAELKKCSYNEIINTVKLLVDGRIVFLNSD